MVNELSCCAEGGKKAPRGQESSLKGRSDRIMIDPGLLQLTLGPFLLSFADSRLCLQGDCDAFYETEVISNNPLRAFIHSTNISSLLCTTFCAMEEASYVLVELMCERGRETINKRVNK